MSDRPVNIDGLEGRRFTNIGDEDCYKLVADFVDLNFGLKLTPFARPEDWQSKDNDLIRKLYQEDGWQMITEWGPKDIRPADIVACTVADVNPNHLLIYLGNDEVLHHLLGRLSRVEPFSGFWRHHASFLLRHPDIPDLREKPVTQDLAEFINARNAPPSN